MRKPRKAERYLQLNDHLQLAGGLAEGLERALDALQRHEVGGRQHRLHRDAAGAHQIEGDAPVFGQSAEG